MVKQPTENKYQPPPPSCMVALVKACTCKSLHDLREILLQFLIPVLGDFVHWSILPLQERSPSYTTWGKKKKSFKQIEENNEATGCGFGKNVDQ